jgi:hypothetical protein
LLLEKYSEATRLGDPPLSSMALESVSVARLLRRKTGFLLIEVFSKLFNTQNYGHQGTILGGRFL